MLKHSNESEIRARYYKECMRCLQYCCRWLMHNIPIHGAMVDQFCNWYEI